MAIQLQKAKRIQAKIKIALGGASGSGKTLSSLLLAHGLVKAAHSDWTEEQIWDHIAVIDTENKSSSLYVGKQVGPTLIGAYNVINMEPPYEEQSLIDAIGVCQNAQMEVTIIDSTSAFWVDALETQGKIAERTKSNFSAWKPVKADQNKMMQAILQCDMHIIANYRAKMEYTQDTNDAGKKVVRQIGMGIIAEGTNIYEYTLVFFLDADHVANATKDRTGIFDGMYFTITSDTGRKIYQWISEGEVAPNSAPVIQKAAPAPAEPDEQVKKAITMIDALAKEKCAAEGGKEAVAAVVEETLGTKNYKKCTDIDKLRELYSKLKAM